MKNPKLYLALDTSKLSHDIGRLADKKRELAKKRVFDAGDVFENVATTTAPRLTGALQLSIRKDNSVDLKGPKVEVGADEDYAIFQEFGTSTHGPSPFIRPGLRQAVSHLKARVR